MSCNELQFVGPNPGRWLQDSLTVLDGRVGCVVPDRYPAYARVLHRIDPDDRAIRWSDVCAATGAVAHPLMQWHMISRGWTEHTGPDPLQGRGSDDPQEGNLDRISMTALYAILTQATAVGQGFHAFWTGWGGLRPGSVSIIEFGGDGHARTPPDSAFPFPPANIWCSPARSNRDCSPTGQAACFGRSPRTFRGRRITPGAWPPK